MNHPYDLDAAALDRGWRELRSDIEIDHAPVEHPTVVFLGAQPAAGKSHAQAEILRWYDRPMFTVDSDELRAHHPAFEEIMSTDPQRMPVLTNQAASEWTRRSIQYARQHRLDTIIENTFHNPTVIRDSAADLRAAGHRVHAVAAALDCTVTAIADRAALAATTRVLYGLEPLGPTRTLVAGQEYDLTDAEADRVADFIAGLIAARDLD